MSGAEYYRRFGAGKPANVVTAALPSESGRGRWSRFGTGRDVRQRLAL